MAENPQIQSIFERYASKAPQFALSAAYLAGGSNPIILTSGPTQKGGAMSVSDSAQWHIGSLTMSFTAALIMRLVDQGVLSLDAPVSTYLVEHASDMHADWKALTLRQLLSHTSGLVANAPRKSLQSTRALDPFEGRRSVLAALWQEEVSGSAGDFTYSNIGYVLAGMVAEEATGKSWETLIVSEIAEPLGLNSLGFGAPRQPDSPLGHQSIFGFKTAVDPENLKSDNPRWMGPAGTIHLSMSDLVRWGKSHILACRGEIPTFLSEASCKAMQLAVSNDYGFGWVISENKNAGPIFWHNGSNTLWYAIMTVFPKKGVVVAAATNVYAPQRTEALMHEISEQLVGALE